MSPFYKQVLEAAGWTFFQVFVVTFGSDAVGLANLDWGGLKPIVITAAMAAAGAALSIVKSMIVRNIGGTESTLISAAEECGEA